MLDQSQRLALMERLNQKVKKASSNVSTKVEAVKGPFKVILSENVIDQFYKEFHVGSIKTAQLDDEVIELINSDVNNVAQEMVESFSKTFDIAEFELKQAESNKNVKEAANTAVDKNTSQMTTQKQLDSKRPTMHPRTNEFPTNVTEKQLPENGYRPGTYTQVTEAQLKDEKSTFYNEPRSTGAWKDEDRHDVTEAQFNEGVSNFTEFGKTDRGEISSKFDGGLEKQHQMVAEKQLEELLKHHEYTSPNTITEGKEQLGKQDGELSRLTAETANALVKESMNVLAKTVLSAGATPKQIVNVIKKLTSHHSKYPVLANVIKDYKDMPISVITDKVKKAQYFGKVANANQNCSDYLVADIIIRQLSKMSYDPSLIVNSITALASDTNSVEMIDKQIDEVMKTNFDDVSEASFDENNNLIRQALSQKISEKSAESTSNQSSEISNKVTVEGDASDGLYQYAGVISEVNENTSNRDKFATDAANHAKKIILASTSKTMELVPMSIDVNEGDGTFKVVLKDPVVANDTLQSRSEKRHKMASKLTKSAQVPPGGMPPASGSPMGNPTTPPSASDMGGPPAGEAFSQTPPPPVEDTDNASLDPSSGEPKPPGSLCPVCGSSDVDVDNGDIRCNGCGAEGTVHVKIDITKWPDIINESEKAEDGGFGIGSENEQEIGDIDTEENSTTLPNVPVAASVKVTHLMLEKLAKQNKEIGSSCPNCGSSNTDMYKSAHTKGKDAVCWDCMQEYNVQIKTNPAKKNNVFAQFVWTPKTSSARECANCTKLHTAFVSSLKNYGMAWNKFDKMSLPEKAETILKMNSVGALDIKEAMNKPISFNKFAAANSRFDKFPSASCMERIARKFGENATAMSGPCQGKPLADCVCRQLENLGVYTDGLAAKVASTISNSDPMINNPIETCVKMFVKDYDYNIRQACTICDGLRAATASEEDIIIESIMQVNPYSNVSKTAQFSNMPMGKKTTNPIPSSQDANQSKPMHSSEDVSLDDHPLTDPVSSNIDENGPSESPMSDITPVPDDSDTDISVEISGPDDTANDVSMESDPFSDNGISFDDFGANSKDLKTIIVDGLQSIIDALQGNVSDDIIDTTGDSDVSESPVDSGISESPVSDDLGNETSDTTDLDTGDVTENPITDSLDESVSEDESTDTDSETDIDSDTHNDIPGVESDEGDSELVKSGNPDETKDMESCCPKTDTKTDVKTDHKPEVKEEDNKDCCASSDSLNKTAGLESTLMRMKRGTISNQNSSLSSLYDALIKQAAKSKQEVKKVEYTSVKESKLVSKPAQDDKSVGKIQDKGTIGYEEPFAKGVKTSPDVPRGKATLGDEGTEVAVNDKDYPKIPQNAPEMDGEGTFKAEKQTVIDGNQGKTHSASQSKQVKTASCECGKDTSCKNCNCCNNCCKCTKTAKKTAQKTVSPKPVESLADDKDLNKTTGAGKGKVQVDKSHSLAADEKKPSEGVSKLEVPKAPNDGRLENEHTLEKAKDGPTIPANGGTNPVYDQDEKKKPEKLDETLGKVNGTSAMASNNDRAIKIAAQMLKTKLITVEEMPSKIAELSKASSSILNDIEKMLKEANSKKGLQKEAGYGVTETSFQINNLAGKNKDSNNLVENIQSLFKLNKKNSDYERFVQKRP